ncbi:MAG: YabP/YqfC family sporulation protein [Ruminococcus sp.]|nr:YabP/YqfC family sporulation protein [Ruminococcus sp.]
MKKKTEDKTRDRGFSLAYSVRDMIKDVPHIEIDDNRSVTLEGSKGIVEYCESRVSVLTGAGIVAFSGENMNLRCISPTNLIIEGDLSNIEFGL